MRSVGSRLTTMPEHRTTTEAEDHALIEAALFLAPQPLTRRGLARILGDVQVAYVDRLLAALKREYEAQAHGLELHLEEGHAGFRVKAAYVDRVSHLAPQQDIPRPILRSLAVIAYNHPMTQSDLIKVRGNKAYAHVQELLARNLIHAEEHGRTLLLHVTKEFLRHFGLGSVEEFRFHVAGLPEPETEIQTKLERESESESKPAREQMPGSEAEPEEETEPEAEAPPSEGGG
jgi:segregation and condensation protein B